MERKSVAGYLFCVEGIDGAGKSTVAKKLVHTLKELGIDAIFASRDSQTESKLVNERLAMIANALWNYSPDSQIHKLGDRHLILLMAAWYHLFDETIVRPARNAGKTVITDQWIYKYLARFRAKDIYWAGSYFDGLSEANGVLLLDVPPEVGATRKTHFKHTESESCESGTESGFITFQKKVLLEFVQFQNSSWHTINGDQDPDIVIDQALKIVIRLQQ